MRPMRPSRQRTTMFPWVMIGAGAFVFWTIALGIGIPSLGRVLGTPGPARWAAPTEARCVSTATVDGRPVAFGDCINVRFVLDSPEFGRPAFTVPRPVRHMHVYAGPDPEIHVGPLEAGEDVQVVAPPELDSVGRTAY
jgi:hypothetical protein